MLIGVLGVGLMRFVCMFQNNPCERVIEMLHSVSRTIRTKHKILSTAVSGIDGDSIRRGFAITVVTKPANDFRGTTGEAMYWLCYIDVGLEKQTLRSRKPIFTRMALPVCGERADGHERDGKHHQSKRFDVAHYFGRLTRLQKNLTDLLPGTKSGVLGPLLRSRSRNLERPMRSIFLAHDRISPTLGFFAASTLEAASTQHAPRSGNLQL